MSAQGFLAAFEAEPQGLARLFDDGRAPARERAAANLPDAARLPVGRYDEPAFIGECCWDGAR